MTPTVTRERLILTADLSEPVGSWTLVATIPFGSATGALGLVTDVHRTPIPYVPRSFAVAPDGSIWILDVVKRRVAHYSPSGAFLGEIGGFKFDRFSPHPRDMVFSGGRMVVLEEDHLHAILVTVEEDGTLSRTRARIGGTEVGLVLLYPANRRVAGLLVGRVTSTGGDEPDVAAFDPAIGYGALLPGVPTEGNRWIDLHTPSDDELTVRFSSAESQTDQPILIRAVTETHGRLTRVPLVAGPSIEAATDGGVAIGVRISPARPEDAERYGGGVWLLRIGSAAGALLWERLPAADISDEEQVRHLCSGPGGRLYLMVPTKEGEAIYRK